MIKKSILIFILFIPAMTAHGWQALGPGASTCGTWIEARKGINWYDLTGWVLGYYAASQDQAGMSLEQIDLAGVESFLDNYCAERPLDSILDASRALIVELKPKGE